MLAREDRANVSCRRTGGAVWYNNRKILSAHTFSDACGMGEQTLRYYDEKIETMPRPEMEALQLKRLRKTVDYVLERVPFYRERLASAGIRSGEDIRSLKEIEKIPFRISEMRILTDSLPFRGSRSDVSMPLPGRPGNLRSGIIRRLTWRRGRSCPPGCSSRTA